MNAQVTPKRISPWLPLYPVCVLFLFIPAQSRQDNLAKDYSLLVGYPTIILYAL